MGENCCTLRSWPVDLPSFCFKFISNTGSGLWRNFRNVIIYSWKVKKNPTVCIGSPVYSSFRPSFTCVRLHESPCSQGKTWTCTVLIVWVLFVKCNTLFISLFTASGLIRVSLHRSIWFGLENYILFEQHTANILGQSKSFCSVHLWYWGSSCCCKCKGSSICQNKRGQFQEFFFFFWEGNINSVWM